MFAHLGSACDFSSLAQYRYAFSRHSSMNSGSCFFTEMTRMTSSFKPAGIESDSMSVTKPYLYSFFVRSSTVFVAVFIFPFLCRRLNREGSAATAGFLHIRILEDKPRLHQLFFVIQFSAAEIKQTFHIDQNFRPVLLENFVGGLRQIEIKLVLQPRATSADDFKAQSLALSILSRNHLFDFGCSLFGHIDSTGHTLVPPNKLRLKNPLR